MHVHYNRIAGSDVGRIEALSAGIFAFAATVLVLDFSQSRRYALVLRIEDSLGHFLHEEGMPSARSTMSLRMFAGSLFIVSPFQQ